jgi:hypothetical protein
VKGKVCVWPALLTEREPFNGEFAMSNTVRSVHTMSRVDSQWSTLFANVVEIMSPLRKHIDISQRQVRAV